MSYDSMQDTKEHIENVRSFLQDIIENLWGRQIDHDASKLLSPEKEAYDQFTPMLKSLTYGSEEYNASLKRLGQALLHHYEHNSHHPEHYGYQECDICFTRHPLDHKGRCMACAHGTFTMRPHVAGMSLLDVIEMLADWKAAGLRHADGDLRKSLEINKARFEISDQLFEILTNTAKELGWIK